jgi:hypothetical protein
VELVEDREDRCHDLGERGGVEGTGERLYMYL